MPRVYILVAVDISVILVKFTTDLLMFSGDRRHTGRHRLGFQTVRNLGRLRVMTKPFLCTAAAKCVSNETWPFGNVCRIRYTMRRVKTPVTCRTCNFPGGEVAVREQAGRLHSRSDRGCRWTRPRRHRTVPQAPQEGPQCGLQRPRSRACAG